MASGALVSYADLLAAFEWVSSSPAMENEAFVSRETGATHWVSTAMDLDEEPPEDIDDASLYVAVPHKNDLDLGKELALSFADEMLPESYAKIDQFFRQRGAYRRFKDFLEQKGMIQQWYDYEAAAVERALREWCEDNDIQLKP
jgi:hypothetical protein